MTAEQASTHPLRRKGFALATFAAAAVGVSAFALAAATGDLSGGGKISDGGGGGVGLFGMRRAAAAAGGSPASSSSSSSGSAVPDWGFRLPYGPASGPNRARILAEIREENDWKTDFVLGKKAGAALRARLPRVAVAWIRNYLAELALYFGVGGIWVYYIYFVFGSSLFPGSFKENAGLSMPPRAAVLEQIRVASKAMPLYALLPSLVESAAERGGTASFSRIDRDVGGVLPYLLLVVCYMSFVEWGVYWVHRGLHDWKTGYRKLHHVHHKYNKESSLSPFAGLAFSPLDGIAQALPYAVGLLFVPVHFFTHEMLLFLTAIWTNSIHDCLDAKMEPIMGAGYHSIHHTTYRHNYGHYFTYMDGLHGTLVSPREHAEEERRRNGGGGAGGGGGGKKTE